MTSPRPRHVALIACVILAACGQEYAGDARPTTPALIRERGWLAAPAPVVRQSTIYDCGPASLAMVTRRWGLSLTRDEITLGLGLYDRGARLGELRDVARQHGLRADAIAGDRGVLVHELERRRPVLIALSRRYGRRAIVHFEVVVGLHPDGLVVTIDPSAGWQVRTWSEFDAEWAPVGHAALLVAAVEGSDR